MGNTYAHRSNPKLAYFWQKDNEQQYRKDERVEQKIQKFLNKFCEQAFGLQEKVDYDMGQQ